jgi:AraC family transcriptional regulator of adaptative response/methylated-DNA-[protein]-cysteine methyltransferase
LKDADSEAPEPERVRRWFQRHHGMTFHAYHGRSGRRARIREGRARGAAYESGYESLRGSRGVPQGDGHDREGAAEAPILLHRLTTPLGPMIAGATEKALLLLEFADRRSLETEIDQIRARTGRVAVPGMNAPIQAIMEELEAYFAGRLRDFTVSLEARGSDFQRAVWEGLRAIPYARREDGEQTDAGVPARIGARGRARERREPDRDRDPRHRVIGADGRLTGTEGVWRKRRPRSRA